MSFRIWPCTRITAGVLPNLSSTIFFFALCVRKFTFNSRSTRVATGQYERILLGLGG